jgi:iron complex outermembrane receptor protein
MKIKILWATVSALSLSWGGLAAAQTGGPAIATPPSSSPSTSVQEVVVTAERRSTNLQSTAIAATVLTQSDLLKNGVITVDQLQFLAPSLTVNNFGQGDDFDIRGIGKGEHNSQTGTGVITYRDGVATFPGYFAEEPYFDVANVQILRGPQGTFSGQNATGGAVIVNTQNPVINGGYTGYILGHYGNYDDVGFQGAVNLPISDTLAARVAFNDDYHHTWFNVGGPWTGNPNTRWSSTRLSLLWEPTSALKVSLKTDYDYLDNGAYWGEAILNPTTGALNSTNNLYNFNNNYRTYATDQFVRSILQVDYTFSDGIDLRSVSGFQKGRTAWTGDIDGTDLASPNYIIDEAADETLWSQEVDIISPSKGPITWILGAYYAHNYYGFPTFDVGLHSFGIDEAFYGVNATNNAAVFGQVTFKLGSGLELQVGGRYSYWDTVNHVDWFVPQYDYSLLDNQYERGDNASGKVALNWQVDSRNFLYVFVASAAQPGGLNDVIYFTNVVPAPFKQEYVTDFEGGWKSSLFDNHLHLQLGAYYNLFKNFQAILPIPDNPLQVTEVNDPQSTKLYGFEASAQAVFGALSFNMGLGLEHSSVGAFYAEDPRLPTSGTCNATSGPANGVCVNLAGHPQTYAPSTTFNVSAQYAIKLASGDVITPAANFAHISHQWATLFDNAAQGDYLAARNILGASLAWTHGTYTATLYGYNLTNDKYVSAVLPPILEPGAPRLFGVSVLKTF